MLSLGPPPENKIYHLYSNLLLTSISNVTDLHGALHTLGAIRGRNINKSPNTTNYRQAAGTVLLFVSVYTIIKERC